MAVWWSKISGYFMERWCRLSKTQKCLIIVLCLLIILIPFIASADFADTITKGVVQILTAIVSVLVSFVGKVLALVLHCLVYVAQYNNFINETVVKEGWKVVRDVCNMFFVLGLLLIAFGTVLRLPNYQAKNSLKNFVLGAVLVNFSKTICGLILDFAQIIMLTFVNGFKDVGVGNLTEMLGLTSLFDVVVNEAEVTAIQSVGIFVSYLMGLIYLIVALVVILTMTIMLIQRAVMLWLFIVLSPFPYLLSSFPQSGKMGSLGKEWWNRFSGLVITGPLLAFFIWLSFFTASSPTTTTSTNNKEEIQLTGLTAEVEAPTEGDYFGDLNAGVTKSTTAQAIIKFLVSIGILITGMTLTKEASSMVGNVVGAGMGALQKTGKGAVNFAKKGTTKAATNTAKWAGRNALKGAGGLITTLTKNSTHGIGKTLNKVGTFAKTWGEDLTESRHKEKVDKRLKTLKKMGMGEKSMGALKEVTDDCYDWWSRFAKGPARKLDRDMENSRIMAHEKVNKDYHNAVQGAADKRSEDLTNLARAKDEGKITKDEYNKQKNKIEEDFQKAKEEARQAMIVEQKRISHPEIDQKFKEIEQEKSEKTKEIETAHAQRVEDAANERNKIIDDNTRNKDEAQKQFADGAISKTEMERLLLKADLNIKQANADYDKKVEESQKIKETESKQVEKDYQEKRQTIIQDIKDVPVGDSMERLMANFSVGSFVSNLAKSVADYKPMSTTSEALQKGVKEKQEAKDNIAAISSMQNPGDLAKLLDPQLFSAGIGNAIKNAQREFYALLSNGQRSSQQAIKNLINAIQRLDANNEKDKVLLLSIKNGVQTYQRQGGDPAGRLDPLLKEASNSLKKVSPSEGSSESKK
ncbi:MAG TPA: hypothetical protein P5194_01310 [Patescibacteria group bacterium]|nr:hypothetical protein [Patescibacteria group bacterium]